MTNVYLHDSQLGIHYQEDSDVKLWIIKQKGSSLVFFSGTPIEIKEYHKNNKTQIIEVFAFSDMLLEYMNIVGDKDLRPVMPLEKYVSAGEQVL